MGRAVLGIVVVVIAVLVLTGIGFVVWARQPAIAPTSPPVASSFDKATVARGATLVAMGNCAECHTAPGGQPFAGGYPVQTPFGTIYGMNITPDTETGIGQWSEAAFLRAMHEGIRRNGEYLYPAFPYTHFARVSDQDIAAIYAYLMTQQPVHHSVPPPGLPFPLNIRFLMAGWNLLYFDAAGFTPDSTKSAAWNRGAYIAQGLGHCGDCHTLRNWLGAEIAQNRYSGGSGEGWEAPALNGSSPAPIPWSKEQLVAYFTEGFAADHGTAAGPMADVSRELQKLPESDVLALATYIASFSRPAAADSVDETVTAARKAAYEITTAGAMRQQGPAKTGEAIFAGTCASCHFEGGSQPFYRPARLALSSVVNAPEPRNFIHIVIDGIQPPAGVRGRWMPPFGAVLSNEQIGMLAQYVRSRFSDKPAWANIDNTVADIRGGKEQ